jgi:hypothetical protein
MSNTSGAGPGAIVVVCVALVVVAVWLRRRFRVAGSRASLERMIELWVARVRAGGGGLAERESTIASLLARLLLSVPGPVRPHVEAIAGLDAGYEAGRLHEDGYLEARDALKRQVCLLLAGR